MVWTVTKKSGTSASCGGEGIDLKYAGQLYERRVNRSSGFSELFTTVRRNIFQKFNVAKYSRFGALTKISIRIGRFKHAFSMFR